jgi:mono/diheme cytochrome c family protein
MPFESYLARKAQHARIDKEMPKSVPVQATEANYVAAAEIYKQDCAVCHGLPLAPKTAIASGMYPHPPQLFQGKGVTDDEPGETYWKVYNGFRLTGMPGFSKSLTEMQIWYVSLLLANADKLPASAKAALVAPPAAATANVAPATGTTPATPTPPPAQPAK